MDKHILVLVHVTNRATKAGNVNQLLSEYGRNIKTRLGLHEVNAEYDSPAGVIVLEMFGEEERSDELVGKLSAIEGIAVKKVVFEHPWLKK